MGAGTRVAALAVALAVLAGCAGRKPDAAPLPRTSVTQPPLPVVQPTAPAQPTAPPVYGPVPTARRLTFDSLPGWNFGDHAPILTELSTVCEVFSNRARDESVGGLSLNGEPLFGRGADWGPICTDASRTDSRSARAFFEKWFEPVSINGAADGTAALYTGYFEPELRGSRIRTGPYQFPIYRRPPDLRNGAPYLERAQIDAGALAGRGLELYWIDDPVEAFFLEIQGSGRVRLPDGRVARVGFAGKNNRPYKAIGKTLVEWGELPLEAVSAQSIKQWIRNNPSRRAQLLQTNRSYVFFEDKPALAADPSLGPIGSFGTPIPALRTVAVDRSIYALGSPVYVDFPAPAGPPIQRLTLALDTGGAIKGSRRADFYYGTGAGAGAAAGLTRARGRLVALAPTAALRRVFRAGS